MADHDNPVIYAIPIVVFSEREWHFGSIRFEYRQSALGRFQSEYIVRCGLPDTNGIPYRAHDVIGVTFDTLVTIGNI